MAKRRKLNCAERDRLGEEVTSIHTEYSRMQDLLRKVVKRQGDLGQLAPKFEEIGKRLIPATKLYGTHVARHQCVCVKANGRNRKQESGGSGK
jgi:hypothetical protein